MSYNHPDMTRLADGLPTKSAKIRCLGRAGYSRSEIAEFLGIRYQHVRNVLVDAERSKGEATKEAPATDQSTEPNTLTGPGATVRLHVGAGGTLVLPAVLLTSAGIKEGDSVVASSEQGEIRLATSSAAMRQVQAILRRYVPEGVSLVDDLLQERRREVARE